MSESSTMLDGDGDERGGGNKGEDDDENDGDDGDGQLSIEITSFEGRAEHAMFDIPNLYNKDLLAAHPRGSSISIGNLGR